MSLTAEPYQSYTLTVPNSSHIPNSTVIDLDYPMYGTVFIKCRGNKYTLSEVKAALNLVDEARKVNKKA